VPELLPLKDFRARRRVLTKEDFAIAGDDVPPQDLIAKSTWKELKWRLKAVLDSER
jgi:hypothetical protein